jgi:hypothetical protein
MQGSQNPKLPMLLRWPDGIRNDQELVRPGPDALPDWAFSLAAVVWIGVPAVFWGGIAAWLFG